MPWHGNTPPELAKMCSTCKDAVSRFHGFGLDLCWPCYNLWRTAPTMEIRENQLTLFSDLELPKFGPGKIGKSKFRKSA